MLVDQPYVPKIPITLAGSPFEWVIPAPYIGMVWVGTPTLFASIDGGYAPEITRTDLDGGFSNSIFTAYFDGGTA